MFEILWQFRYHVLLVLWMALLGVGTWLRFKVLASAN
jgi:hypothetical protein